MALVAPGAFVGTENLVLPGMVEKLLSNKRSPAHATLEARVGRVPEVALIFDPLSVSVNDIPAFKALPGIQTVVALHTVRMAITSHVQHISKIQITLVTTEVLTVPVALLSLSVFPTKDQFITGSTAWLEQLSVMSAAVDGSFLEEINQIHQEIVAN